MDTADANAVRLLVHSLTSLAADPEAQFACLGAWSPNELAEDHQAPAFNAQWMTLLLFIKRRLPYRYMHITDR